MTRSQSTGCYKPGEESATCTGQRLCRPAWYVSGRGVQRANVIPLRAAVITLKITSVQNLVASSDGQPPRFTFHETSSSDTPTVGTMRSTLRVLGS